MLFFIDESGQDHGDSPYEVLAGLAIQERMLWPLVHVFKQIEVEYFGKPLSEYGVEFKGKKLLKNKIFRFAEQAGNLPPEILLPSCISLLEKGVISSAEKSPVSNPTAIELTAYGQSVGFFIHKVLTTLPQFNVKLFASIIAKNAQRPAGSLLRKDYSYLFQRFFHYLEDIGGDCMGIVVFDELEKSQCHILINQMERYFLETGVGRERSSRIIPEPFFVHSDLTTAIQLVDVAAYCLNWGYRFGKKMTLPVRPEIEQYVKLIIPMQYAGKRQDEKGNLHDIYGITYIDDLRPKKEKDLDSNNIK